MPANLEGTRWVTTWGAALFPNTLLPNFGDEGFANQTIRMELPLSVGGSTFRLRLSNRCGSSLLCFAAVTVGPMGGPYVPVTFAGRTALTLPAGSEGLSDPVEVTVAPLEPLVVSLYAAEPTGPPTRSKWYFGIHGGDPLPDMVAPGQGYIAAGDRATAATPAFEPVEFEGFVAAVEVLAPATVGTVAIIGDSLSLWYPSFLARAAVAAGRPLAVSNVAINGNRLLSRSPCHGEAGLARFATDVLLETGVQAVIAMWINDIGMTNFSISEELRAFMPPAECFYGTNVTAEDLIVGWRLLLARARAAGLQMLGGTTPPFKGSLFYTPQKDEIRRTVNDWIRFGGEFDHLVDFDAALRDEVDPDQIAPQYHIGDFMHPTLAGATVMANAIDLDLLAGPEAQPSK